PYVAARLAAGGDISAADFIAMIRERDRTCAAVQAATRHFDALLLPTSATIPMAIDGLQGIETLMKASARVLRNTALSNYLDRPTISLPCHAAGDPPVGLSVMGSRGHDRRLLAIAAGIENVVKA
ncbi:MAG: amidase family protein, partial [Candidatus Puniceispirillaceae bacterium]